MHNWCIRLFIYREKVRTLLFKVISRLVFELFRPTAAMEAGVKYIDEVFRVVRQNATNINDVPTLQKLLEAVGSFYVSLFAQDDRSEGEYQLHACCAV